MVEFKNVSLSFGDHIVLDRLSFKIASNERVMLVGRSGAGKTTILKLILRLINPDAGEIYQFGHNIAALNEDKLNRLRQRTGLVFQNGALFESLTIEENVGFFLVENLGLPKKEVHQRVRDIMKFLNMEDTLSLYPRELSGGMVRRVAIARAMVYEPELILYDEPTTGLDPISTSQVVHLMRHMLERHQHTIFIVTHELHNFVDIVNRMLFIQRGSIIYDGQVDTEIFDRLGGSD